MVPSAMARVSALLIAASWKLLTCRCKPSKVASTLFMPMVTPDSKVKPIKRSKKARSSPSRALTAASGWNGNDSLTAAPLHQQARETRKRHVHRLRQQGDHEHGQQDDIHAARHFAIEQQRTHAGAG